jgi:hypothetical protein
MQAKDLEGFLTDNERERSERQKRLLLNGPQHENEAIKQKEVDALFS